jgi:hypothetical protein
LRSGLFQESCPIPKIVMIVRSRLDLDFYLSNREHLLVKG